MAPSASEYSESRHSRFELTTLIDTSRILVESHDLDFVLNNLLLIAMGKMMCSKSMILLYNKRDDTYRVAKKKGRLIFEEGQKVQFRNQEELLNFSSITESDTDAESRIPSQLTREGMTSLYNIYTSNQHIGLLALGSKANKQPTEQHERSFLESLVLLSAAAIANSEMFQELKNTNRKLDLKLQELNTLFDLSKEFNASVDREQIIRIFKFALMGQMFIRSFFLVMKIQGEYKLVTQVGLKHVPEPGDLEALFALNDRQQFVTEAILEKFPFLEQSGMDVLLRVKMQNEDSAVIGVGKRAAQQGYNEYDFNFLTSLCNLTLMSVQKTYLLEQQIEKERMEEELRLARQIQERLLPTQVPVISGLEISAINIPSREVGGDYYDFLLDGNGKLHASIADVTGKGIPASLLMANMQSMMHMITPLHINLPDAVGQINNIMYRNTPADKFVTFFWGAFDPADRSFCYINAGHNPPIHYQSKDGSLTHLTEGGMLIGIMETMMPYTQGATVLAPDDVIVLFTDGVTEAMSPTDEEYGDDRLEELIKANVHLSASGIQEEIIKDVKQFTNNVYSDDFTMIVLKGIA